jgi:hypothetical protein
MSNTTSSVPGATLYYQLFLCCLAITSAGAATCLYKCATDTILSNASPKEWAHTQTTLPCRSRSPLQTLSPSRISEGRGSGCLAPDRDIFQIGYPATTRGSASTAPLSLLRERLASREQHTSIPSKPAWDFKQCLFQPHDVERTEETWLDIVNPYRNSRSNIIILN